MVNALWPPVRTSHVISDGVKSKKWVSCDRLKRAKTDMEDKLKLFQTARTTKQKTRLPKSSIMNIDRHGITMWTMIELSSRLTTSWQASEDTCSLAHVMVVRLRWLHCGGGAIRAIAQAYISASHFVHIVYLAIDNEIDNIIIHYIGNNQLAICNVEYRIILFDGDELLIVQNQQVAEHPVKTDL